MKIFIILIFSIFVKVFFFVQVFSQVGFTFFSHGLICDAISLVSFILVSGDVHWSQWGW